MFTLGNKELTSNGHERSSADNAALSQMDICSVGLLYCGLREAERGTPPFGAQ